MIDFSFIRKQNLHFTTKIKRFFYNDIDVENIEVTSFIRHGKMTTTIKNANLFGGKIDGEMSIDDTAGYPRLNQDINIY